MTVGSGLTRLSRVGERRHSKLTFSAPSDGALQQRDRGATVQQLSDVPEHTAARAFLTCDATHDPALQCAASSMWCSLIGHLLRPCAPIPGLRVAARADVVPRKQTGVRRHASPDHLPETRV